MFQRVHRWLSLPQVRTPLLVGGTTRLAMLLVAWFCAPMLHPSPSPRGALRGGQPHTSALLDSTQRFESFQLLEVAREGYRFPGAATPRAKVSANTTNIDAFPLYPLLMRGLGVVTTDLTLAGVLLSMAAFLGALAVFYSLVRQDPLADHELASRAVLYLSLFPTGWLYGVVHTESLFLLLSLLTLHQARRGRILTSGLCGLGASLTRFNGALLALPVVAEFAFGRGTRPNPRGLVKGLIAAALGCAGWVAYFIYLERHTGSFWSFVTVDRPEWWSSLVAPWTPLWGLLAPGLLASPPRLLQLCSLVLFVTLAIRAVRQLRLSHSFYLAEGVVTPLCYFDLHGLPRRLMLLFPAFTSLAQWARTPDRHLLVALCFATLQAGLMLIWLQWSYSF